MFSDQFHQALNIIKELNIIPINGWITNVQDTDIPLFIFNIHQQQK